MTRKVNENIWDIAFIESKAIIPSSKSDFIGRTVLIESLDRIMTMRVKHLEGGRAWIGL
jgi:hypothetical protein